VLPSRLKSGSLPALLKSVLYFQMEQKLYRLHMAKMRWVLKCNNCRAECTYAEIPSQGTSNYFLPKRPEVPAGGFKFKCPNCAHEDTYKRTDLTCRDDSISPNPASTKCA
jgi:hypothetical protein